MIGDYAIIKLGIEAFGSISLIISQFLLYPFNKNIRMAGGWITKLIGNIETAEDDSDYHDYRKHYFVLNILILREVLN